MAKDAAPLDSDAEDATRLRDCLNDLAGIMALPALSTGGEPGQVVSALLDALLGTLPLTFALVRLNDPKGGPSIETMRVAESSGSAARADVSFASARLGFHGEIGIVVAGSERRDFPARTDRLMLDVAANQAAIGLQHARLLSDQRRFATELEALREKLREDVFEEVAAQNVPEGAIDTYPRAHLR